MRQWLRGIDDMSFRRTISATAMAAGAAVMALSGIGVAADEAGRMPDTSSTFALPEVLPPGTQGGTIETPVGPARWIGITGPVDEVPRLGTLLPWGDGLAIWRETYGPDGLGASSLQATDDGASWASAPLPDDFVRQPGPDGEAEIFVVDDTVYLIQPRDGRMWRSTLDGDWSALDTSAMERARPTGWDVPASWAEAPEIIDGELVFRVHHSYKLPRKRLGLVRKVATNELRRVGNDRYVLCHPSRNVCKEGQAPVVLTIKETDSGLVVRNQRTGERLGLLEDAAASELYEGKLGEARQAFALRGDELVSAEWPGEAARRERERRPAGAPEEIRIRRNLPTGWVALALDEADGISTTGWHMHVGEEWVQLAGIDFPELTHTSTYDVGGTEDAIVISNVDYENDTASLWVVTPPERA